MLYKPTNPSPYNSVVDKPTETSPLTFMASCVSTSNISGMRLAIKDNTTEYYLPIADDAVSQCKTTSGVSILYKAETFNVGDSYSIKTSNLTRTDGLSNEAISKIIQPLTSYRWQIRLYQGSADINIGYGFVQDVINFNNSNKPNRRILKVRPHTNMFMGKKQRDEAFGEDDLPEYNKGWNKNLTEYYDENVVYQIQFSGKSYDILNYYYSKEPAYYVGTKPTDLISEKQYDEPLFAFIEIDLKTGDAEIETGAEYTILTNYIDSNEYYFSCRELGKLTFTDPRITGEDNEVKFVSIEELDANPDDHTYSPTHSNVQIKGAFDSKSGATINYYRATLYQVLSNGEDIQIHDSGYVYSSEIDYDCKDLLSGNTYKLVITVTDTYGNTTSKGVYIKPDCGAIVKPTLLSVEPYRKHGSVVLDFGKLLSISGHLSGDNLDDDGKGYKIGELTTVKGEGDVFNVKKDETVMSLSSVDSNTVKGTACSIYPNNTISYSKIDGNDACITCTDPLVNAVFRCNGSDTQTIFELESSQIHYWSYSYYSYITRRTVRAQTNGKISFNFTWENYRFHLLIFAKSKERYSTGLSLYNPDTGESSNAYYYPTAILVDEYYTPYEIMNNDNVQGEITKKIQETILDDGTNYDVPYLAYDDIKMDADSYVHVESAAHDFWWHVIVSKNEVYIKCLNPPVKYKGAWQYQQPINVSKSLLTKSSDAATLTLYGGCAYYNVAIEDGYTSSKMTEDRIEELSDNPFVPLVWNDKSVLLASFKNGLEGGNYDGSYNNVSYFRVYKAFSNQPQLHKVFETDDATETIIEDFTVGCKCPYTYYIVPVCKDSTTGIETIGSIIQSEPIELDDGIIRVIGLKQDPDDFDTYHIDINNIWNFSLNVSNTGFQSNMGKTYNDTPQKYPIEIKNKGFYRSFSINGLLGKYDCEKMDYVDTYDDIIEWENFVNNGEMKLVIDLRGVMTVGTFENNSVDYSENGAKLVSANFSIKQLEDINNITILNRNLLFNPANGKALLMDADGFVLQDSENKCLIVGGGE